MHKSHKSFGRTERVAHLIQRELASIIQQEVKDPRIPTFVNITAVDVSPNFSNAKIYLTVLGKEDEAKLALELLNKAAGYLRSCLAKQVKLRTTPALRFVYDDSIEHGRRLTKLIDEAIIKDSGKET